METVDSVQRALRAWRHTHQRGPVPAELRQRVIALSTELGAEEARRAFGVRAETMDRWLSKATRRHAAKPETAPKDSAFTFVEVTPERASSRPRRERRIQITTTAGARFQIDGEFDVEDLLALVRAFGA